MSNNPLSYEGLKVVIQYMEATLRYQLSCRVPSIHTIEKLIPLKFDTLEFGRLQTRVNQTTYRLGVYRQYSSSEEVPRKYKEENDDGGIKTDLNEHGFQVLTFTGDVTPGDVDIDYSQREGCPWLHNTVFDYEQYLFEKHIELYEKAVTMKLEQSEDLSIAKGEGKVYFESSLFNEIPNPIIKQRVENNILEKILPLTVEKLRETVKRFDACLIPYRCRRDNTPLPFTPLIQLTVESPTGTLVYRHNYTLKLHQAMKKLNTVLFGGRTCVHRSRSLSIMDPLIVIRMPEGFRIRIQELQVAGDVHSNHEALKSIVEEVSYPLNSMTITDRITVETSCGHSIAKSAKNLSIKIERYLRRSCLPFLRSLKNETIRVDCLWWTFSRKDQRNLVKHWLNEDKAVGSSFSYEIIGLEVVTKVFAKISFRFNGIRQMENMVVMPMKNGNRLEVSYASIERQDKHQQFRVEMRVVAAETSPETVNNNLQ